MPKPLFYTFSPLLSANHSSKGKPQISDLTWHHHQESGRMQLIEFSLHDRVKHVGGMSGWGGK